MPPDQSSELLGTSGARLLNGRYELAEKVGEGSFFAVFRGRETDSGRPVAVKILNEQYSGDREFAERLRTEALRTVPLDHPHIVSVYDAWMEGNRIAIATEFVRGINLKDRVRRVAPFPLAVAVDIAAAAAEALEYASAQGVSHGDLRPENILVTPEGQVKLSDFGIGAAVSASSRLQMSALVQSAHYLPPEVANGQPPSPPSDVYSLGTILFEMLAGQPPFQADSPFAIAVKHLNELPPSLRRTNPGVPKAVDGIVLKCLQKDPAARYANPGALLADLRAVRDALRYGKPLSWSPSIEPGPSASSRPAAAAPRVTPPRRAPEPAAASPSRPARVREVESGEPSARLLILLPLMALFLAGAMFALFVWNTQAPKDAIVPSLRGMTRAEAQRALQQRGLTLKVIKEMFDDRVPTGTVLMTNPLSGTQIKQGKAVEAWISRGVEPATVPNLDELREDDARNRIKDAKLSVGAVRYQYDEIVSKGMVISQDPAGGTEVARKTAVSVIVSKGWEPSPPPEPDTTPEAAPPPPGDGTASDGGLSPGGTEGTTTDSGTSTEGGTLTVPLDSGAPQDATPNTERAFDINTKLEGRKGWSRVRIVVTDDKGRREVVNELYRRGQTLHHSIKATGAPGTVRITVYENGRVARDMKF
jgi:serine/threonine protein kinase